MMSGFSLIIYSLVATVAMANVAVPYPSEYNQTQPDGSVVSLLLKGHPYTGVFETDLEGHPVIRDRDGYYVYASHHSSTVSRNGRRVLRPSDRRLGVDRPLYDQPPDYKSLTLGFGVEEEMEKAQDQDILQNEVYVRKDLLCEGMPRSQWCPDNPTQPAQMSRAALSSTELGGVLNFVVLLVKFSDQSDRPVFEKSYYEQLFNGEGQDEWIIPTGSIKTFFETQSYGKLTVNAHVEDWTVAPNTEEYYSFGRNGLTSMFAEVAYSALDRMDQRGFNWSDHDRNSDGVVDALFIIHSGFAAEVGGDDPLTGKPFGTNRIWSHRGAVGSSESWVSRTGMKIGPYATTSSCLGRRSDKMTRIGVIAHETGHLLGLPDLIGKEGNGVGNYDIMGNMWGPDKSQYYPGMMSVWSKMQCGWIQPTLLDTPGTYSLPAVIENPLAFKISHGYPEGEYLLIENRVRRSYDTILVDEGLIIWHIDENTQEGRTWQDSAGWPDQGGWPGNGKHYQIAVLQADGLYELEQGLNLGADGDLWKTGGNLAPGPGNAFAQAGWIYPNTDAYSSSQVFRTGIKLDGFSDPGETMTFTLNIEGFDPAPIVDPTPVPTRQPTGKPSSLPSLLPSPQPTPVPSPGPAKQTPNPTSMPTPLASLDPTHVPSPKPSPGPTPEPTLQNEVLNTGSAALDSESFNNSASVPTATPTYNPTSEPTSEPTSSPTIAPTYAPTYTPTIEPTISPKPSNSPSHEPTVIPSHSPSQVASLAPSLTMQPSSFPSAVPTISQRPSNSPSHEPTVIPSHSPSQVPSLAPSLTMQPSSFPSAVPTISQRPSNSPSHEPTVIPSHSPSQVQSSAPSLTMQPSSFPSAVPSTQPTSTTTPSLQPSIPPSFSITPSVGPTYKPSLSAGPSLAPTSKPTHSVAPTQVPSASPSLSTSPSLVPTARPSSSRSPSISPTASPFPSILPTAFPSMPPSSEPSFHPTVIPTPGPSLLPSHVPSTKPSFSPTISRAPTDLPSFNPTATSRPTPIPTTMPSTVPTSKPSFLPSLSPRPSIAPSSTYKPSTSPSPYPTMSLAPTSVPTISQSGTPTLTSSYSPSEKPSTSMPSSNPTSVPSLGPTPAPSSGPTAVPTSRPTVTTSRSPSATPSFSPSVRLSSTPSIHPSQHPTKSASPTMSLQPLIVTVLSESPPIPNPTKAPTPSPDREGLFTLLSLTFNLKLGRSDSTRESSATGTDNLFGAGDQFGLLDGGS